MFPGGSIGARHVPPREHAPVVGRQRLRGHVRADLLQGGLRATCPRATTPRARRPTPPAAMGTPAGDAAFEASLVDPLQHQLQLDQREHSGTSRRRTRRTRTCSARQTLHALRAAPTSPCARSSARPTSTRRRRRSRRPTAAARSRSRSRSRSTRSGCRTSPPACQNKLDAFFKQWWDTAYSGLPRGRQQAADHGSRPGRPRLLRRQRRLRAYGVDVPGGAGGTVPATLVADARHGGHVRHVHAGRGEGLHGVHDGERHLDGGRRRADRRRPERDSPATWSTARSSLPQPLGGARRAQDLTRRRRQQRRRAGHVHAADRRDRRAAHRRVLKTLTFTLSTTTP